MAQKITQTVKQEKLDLDQDDQPDLLARHPRLAIFSWMRTDKTRNATSQPSTIDQATIDQATTDRQATTRTAAEQDDQLFLDSTLVKIPPLSQYLPKETEAAAERQRGQKRKATEVADEPVDEPAIQSANQRVDESADEAADEDLRRPAERSQQVPTTSANHQPEERRLLKAPRRAEKTADDIEQFLISTFQEFRNDLDSMRAENENKQPDYRPDHRPDHRLDNLEISSDSEESVNEVLLDSDSDLIILDSDLQPRIAKANVREPANGTEEKKDGESSSEERSFSANDALAITPMPQAANHIQLTKVQVGMQFISKIQGHHYPARYNCALCRPLGVKYLFRHTIVGHLLGKRHQQAYYSWKKGRRTDVPMASLQFDTPAVYPKPYMKAPYTKAPYAKAPYTKAPYMKPGYTKPNYVKYPNTRPSFNGYNGWQTPYQRQHAYPDSFDRPHGPPAQQSYPSSRPYAIQNQTNYGYSNGYSNGHSNGYSNGHSNGYSNGYPNGGELMYPSSHNEQPYHSNHNDQPYYNEPSYQANNSFNSSYYSNEEVSSYYPDQGDSSCYPNQDAFYGESFYPNQEEPSFYPGRFESFYPDQADWTIDAYNNEFNASPTYQQPERPLAITGNTENDRLMLTSEDRYLVYKCRRITAPNDDLIESYDHLKVVERLMKEVVAEYNFELPPIHNEQGGVEKNVVLERPVRVGLFAKKLSLKADFKLVELVVPCRVLPTVAMLHLIRENLGKKFEQITDETYTALANAGCSAIDVKAPNCLLIRITLTSNLMRDKAASQRLDRGLNKDACIHALDALIKMDWYLATVFKHKPIALIIKLCRHLKNREPDSWGAFNNWQLQVLCYDLIRSEFKSQPTPSSAFKCVLSRLAEGYLQTSGISVADPCRTDLLKKENFLRRLEPERKALITESARRFYQLAMNNRWDQILGDD